MKKRFYAFLKEHGVLIDYLINCSIAKKEKICYTGSIQGHQANDYIAVSFYWKETTEGWYFWYDLHIEWRKVMYE